MSDLETGVHSGIGSTSTHQIDRMIRHLCHCFGQLSLDRPNATFLMLPAVKTATIVFKNDHDPAVADRIVCGQRLRLEKQESIR